MSATAQGSDSQAVNQNIQQILTEVRGLNRWMDMLNTLLFGNGEGDAGDEGQTGRHSNRSAAAFRENRECPRRILFLLWPRYQAAS